MSGSLLVNRKTYFPNLALGVHKYASVASTPFGSEHYADLTIGKQVTRDALLRILELPLMWDKDGSREFRAGEPIALVDGYLLLQKSNGRSDRLSR